MIVQGHLGCVFLPEVGNWTGGIQFGCTEMARKLLGFVWGEIDVVD